MAIGMVVLWGLVIAAAVVLVRYLVTTRNRRSPAGEAAMSEAERILAARFARGEIDEEEYRRRRESLRSLT